jgi:hypothetical protein
VNKDRRKVVANIFADAAKYVLTAGIISSLLAERLSIVFSIVLVSIFTTFTVVAYFLTPKDKEE